METLYNDSIVKIISNNNDYDWYSPYKGVSDSQSIGTGFFLSLDGYILTCGHCVQDSNLLEINIPSKGKEKYKAKVISISIDYDLAVIKVDLPKEFKFTTLKLGDSDKIIQGDVVNAAGYPLGQDKLKISQGVISGFQAHLLQTDTPINSGNSGGPLVFLNEKTGEYEVIGVNSQKISSEIADNIGYSIPINYFKLLSSFMKLDSFTILHRPRLLCKFMITNNNILKYLKFNEDLGYLIYKINEKSSLYKIGVRKLDLLISFDGYDIDKFGEVKIPNSKEKFNIIDLLYKYPVGKNVKVKYFNKKNGLIEKNMELEYPNFQIENKLINFQKVKEIDYEILCGLVTCNLTINHTQKSQIPEYISSKLKTNIVRYRDDMCRLNGKIFVANILAGSYVYSNSDLLPGIFLKSINDIEVNNINQMRDLIKNEIKNNENFIKLIFDNDKVLLLNIDNLINENKILSENFGYNTSNFFNQLIKLKNT